VHVTLDLSTRAGCSVHQTALLRDLTRDTSVSALLQSLGADTLEIRFGKCQADPDRKRTWN
jgi:hypothetical protein